MDNRAFYELHSQSRQLTTCNHCEIGSASGQNPILCTLRYVIQQTVGSYLAAMPIASEHRAALSSQSYTP